ncbi:MAG: hypothetical protein ACYC61_21735 [Isosphaeraceae bacterium]
MAVVALIPTGVMEHRALGRALAAVFPGHDFVAHPPERHADGFTSCDVASLATAQPGPLPTSLDELAAELVNAIFPGRRGQKVDFAYVVEDLELCNQHQPGLVLGLFRDAVDRYIRLTWSQQSDKIYAQVRERCSFHLFCPMTEAYFFGDPVALTRVGASRPPQLPADVALEDFRTIDQEFLALPAGTKDIADLPAREFHPKCYLRYLCDPTLEDTRRRYRETHQGVAALAMLDWSAVLATPSHCPFLHAFLDDLGAALDSPLPFVSPGHADARVRFPGPKNRILRNL